MAEETVLLDGEENSSRRRILDCAAKLFRQKGYGGTSLRDIAAESGMKAGSLYYHFASKDEILIEVLNIGVQRVFDAVCAAVDALPEDAKFADVINTALRVHLRALHEADDYTSANVRIFGQVPQVVRDGHIASRRKYEEYWIKMLSNAQTKGELRKGANLHVILPFIISGLNGTLEWFDPNKGPVERIASEFAALVLDGITPV